jgi:hypothetical protein
LAGRFSLSLLFVPVPFVPLVLLLDVFTHISKPPNLFVSDTRISYLDIEYGWIGQQSNSGFLDIARPALGVFASLDRF